MTQRLTNYRVWNTAAWITLAILAILMVPIAMNGVANSNRMTALKERVRLLGSQPQVDTTALENDVRDIKTVLDLTQYGDTHAESGRLHALDGGWWRYGAAVKDCWTPVDHYLLNACRDGWKYEYCDDYDVVKPLCGLIN